MEHLHLINEAVNLGIAVYNMRQDEGIRYETLFGDETVGALDATNPKDYVRMLCRAMDLAPPVDHNSGLGLKVAHP